MSDARKKIAKAAEATRTMDLLLADPLGELDVAIRASNGAGIYFDVERVRYALGRAAEAIAKARQIAASTDWPTAKDYDQ